MYETLMQTLRAFVGTGMLRTVMTAAMGVGVVVLAMNTSPSFRACMARAQGGWRATMLALGTGIFKCLMVVLLARLLMTTLAYQGRVFQGQHGRITERNRSAVLMKWGRPHEQREPSIHHTRKRTWVTRQLGIKDEKKGTRVICDSYWKDMAPPVPAADGQLPRVLSVKEEQRDVTVSQKSVVSADVDITIRNSPRTLGNASYAGYEDQWKMKYVIANKSKWETNTRIVFPLPATMGLFDRMYLKIDGEDKLDAAESSGNSIVSVLSMAARSQVVVEVGYSSRGLEHLRYIPRRMTQTGHYRVAMQINGVPPDKLDYPIGSMPPAEKITTLKGRSYTLTWKLDNALTSYDIGIKMPVAEQPAYSFSRLLAEAPVGLVLLLGLLIMPRVIVGQRVSLSVLLVMAIAYCLQYTLMGRLSDELNGFAAPFCIAAGSSVLLVSWFRICGTGARFVRVQDAVVFGVVVILYPLAVTDVDQAALWMQCIYLGMLVYASVLMVLSKTAASRREEALS